VAQLGQGDKPAIVYETADIFMHSIEFRKSSLLSISVESDMTYARPTFVRAERFINSFSLSPSGARALFGARGKFLPSCEAGVMFVISTNTPAGTELWPTLSPTENGLLISRTNRGIRNLCSRTGWKAEMKKAFNHRWTRVQIVVLLSPDSNKDSVCEKTMKLFYVDINSGKPVFDRQDERRDKQL